ncbi:hypothetical protein LCGC14_2542270, partial [marine sediment metagenome]
MKKLGDCYQVGCEAMLDAAIDETFKEDWILCHGTVWHPAVGWHGHCWIEIAHGHIVVDGSNGHNATVMREGYYRAGKIKNVTRYTREEARRMVLNERTYGPWGIRKGVKEVNNV